MLAKIFTIWLLINCIQFVTIIATSEESNYEHLPRLVIKDDYAAAMNGVREYATLHDYFIIEPQNLTRSEELEVKANFMLMNKHEDLTNEFYFKSEGAEANFTELQKKWIEQYRRGDGTKLEESVRDRKTVGVEAFRKMCCTPYTENVGCAMTFCRYDNTYDYLCLFDSKFGFFKFLT